MNRRMKVQHLQLPTHFGTHIITAVEGREMMLVGDEGALLLDLDGVELASFGGASGEEPDYSHRVVAVQKTAAGWRSLHKTGKWVACRFYSSDGYHQISLPLDPKWVDSAVWNSSGNKLAVASKGSRIAVFEMPGGQVLWNDGVAIEVDDVIRPSEVHHLLGWYGDDSHLVSTIEMFLWNFTVVWDAETGKRTALMEPTS